MAKYPVEDTGTGRPIKVRKFPWRLWLYALVMTAAAGAGGYLAWHYKSEGESSVSANSECQGSLKTLTERAGKCETEATASGQKLTTLTVEHDKVTKERDQLAKNLNVSKDELVALREAKEKTEARMKAIDDIAKQFAKMIGTGDLKIAARRGSLVLSLPSEVLFPSGVADLSEEGKIKVLEVAFNLKKFPDRRFMVLGHTDVQPPQKNSPYPDNWALSTARALTVSRVLAQGGVNRKNLIVAGAGEYDEVAPNTSPAGMQRNRRIEIVLLPALNELPPLPPSLDDKDAKDSKDAPKDAKAEPKKETGK
jgi:chemotaxis protein MotB